MTSSETTRNLTPQGSAPDLVSAGIRRMILAGELEGGAQLRQGDLAEQFGTSRIPIREALRYLEAEGLVTMHVNRGFVVSVHSLDQIMEMMEIRIALECRALRLSIPNMVDEDFEEGKRLLNEYEVEANPSGWSDLNWRFHRLLYLPCSLKRLLSLIETNYGQIGRFLRSQVSFAVGRDRPQQDHWRLLNLCRGGHVEEAVRLLQQHITRTQKTVAASVRRPR